MLRLLTIILAFSVAGPAFGQMTDHDQMTSHNMSGDHEVHDHANIDQASMETPSNIDMAGLSLATTPELQAALEAGGQPIVAKVLGAVCDFCAMAMNKTFGKRDEVAATHVDLDAKTLSLVLKPGAELDDETLRKVVKKAGYQVDVIDRDPALPTS